MGGPHKEPGFGLAWLGGTQGSAARAREVSVWLTLNAVGP